MRWRLGAGEERDGRWNHVLQCCVFQLQAKCSRKTAQNKQAPKQKASKIKQGPIHYDFFSKFSECNQSTPSFPPSWASLPTSLPDVSSFCLLPHSVLQPTYLSHSPSQKTTAKINSKKKKNSIRSHTYLTPNP